MNQNGKRTDLAREAVELYNEAERVSGDPDGIRSEEKQVNGMTVYTVEILNEQGAEKLSKPESMSPSISTRCSGMRTTPFPRPSR